VSRIALLEVLDRDGHVKHYLPIGEWPVSVGRALDNDLVLDDAHVAPHHLRIAADESGAVFVEVGDS
jgi:pSer/pThr/pTyr-binding forkhead associated (FHA) protein